MTGLQGAGDPWWQSRCLGEVSIARVSRVWGRNGEATVLGVVLGSRARERGDDGKWTLLATPWRRRRKSARHSVWPAARREQKETRVGYGLDRKN
jgi:hypothetical protein